MIDYRGKKIERATPSMPVLVVGFQDLPEGGDRLAVTSEERYAKELSKYRLERLKEREGAAVSRMSLDKLYEKMGEKGKVTLNLIIKADVKGTIDAINEALKKLENDKVDIHVVHSGVGAITETDVNLAIATGGIIVGFNTRPVSKAKVLAEKEKVEIRTYSVIYDLVEDVRKAMEGLLEPILVERPIGRAEIRKVFIISKMGPVAGCYVTEGKVTRGALVRIRRNGNVLFEGKVGSLKRFKEDVKEVMAGYECGIGIEQCQDMREGDVLEFYVVETQKQTLGTTLS
jgi:translation initiation factor IF-2